MNAVIRRSSVAMTALAVTVLMTSLGARTAQADQGAPQPRDPQVVAQEAKRLAQLAAQLADEAAQLALRSSSEGVAPIPTPNSPAAAAAPIIQFEPLAILPPQPSPPSPHPVSSPAPVYQLVQLNAAESSEGEASDFLRALQAQPMPTVVQDRAVVRAAEPATVGPTNGNQAAPRTFDPDDELADYYESGMGCGDGCGIGCGDGCGDCCGCCPAPIWISGVEATFLSPDINTSGAAYESEDFTNPKFDTFNSFSTNVDSVYLTPRIWLGVQGCEWGLVTRYWHLRANEGDHDGFLDILGWEGAIDTGAFMFSQLDAYTVDFEVTRRFCFADTDLLFSVGARTASIEHFEGVTGITDTTDALINGYGRSYRASRGTGIVLGLYGRKPVFCNSCVNWYYNLRWSALWGKTETDAETFASVIGDEATAYSANGAATSVNDDMFIGEVQLGLEWNYPLVCLPANAFFRSGIEFQRWEGGSGGSESTSFAGIDVDDEPSAEVNTFADARGIDLDLIGFVMGAGLTW